MSKKTNDSDLKQVACLGIHLLVPNYLVQKRNLLLFTSPSRRNINRLITSIYVSLLEEGSPSALATTSLFDSYSQMTANPIQTIRRIGIPAWNPGAIEVLIEIFASPKSNTMYDYSILFKLNRILIHARITGCGSLEQFERLSREVILSISQDKIAQS